MLLAVFVLLQYSYKFVKEFTKIIGWFIIEE